MEIKTAVALWLVEPANTRQALAEALGISTERLQARIAGETPWRWSEVLALADVIGVDVGELAEAERE